MQYLGDKAPGATITLWFTTADADGVPTALASGTISVYKDSSNTESTSGVTLTASADSRTGANRVVIDTSADGSFYSAGSDFTVMLTAGTVDGTSVVGYIVGRFSLQESAAYDAVAAGVSLADGAITANKIASNAITDAKIASGALTAAKFAAGAFDAVWSVATRVLTAGTNIVLAKGTGITGFNDLSAAQVNAEVDAALADYDAPTNAEMVARTLPAAQYATASDLATVDNVVDGIKAVTDNLPDGGALTSIAQGSDLATVDSNVDAIKAKTDDLTFTQSGAVDANIQYVNDVEVAGDGQPGTEWGPAP